MENSDIARILSELADLLDIKGENPFRIRSYLNAVRTIEDLTISLSDMVARGDDLTAIKGIGKSIAEKVAEIVETGTCKALEELKRQLSPSLLELLKLEGMGPKKVKLVYEKLGIDSVDALEKAAREGKLRSLPGMGAKTEEKILNSIAYYRAGAGRFHLSVGFEKGEAFRAYLLQLPGVLEVELAGSLRRRRETVGDIDILVVCADQEMVMSHFIQFPDVAEVIAHGATKSSVRLGNGLQVDCRVVPEESFGAALHYFTGSQAHNIAIRGLANDMDLTINEYGVFNRDTEKRLGGAREDDIFDAVGLPWIPPELRENRGEIDAAQEGRLPELIDLEDIRGDLQMHTTASDGADSILEMAQAAQTLGYEYIAITEHSKAVSVANGLDERRLIRHLKEIEKANKKISGLRILKSVEVDIMADGSLDLDDAVLAECDVVVAAIHYMTNMTADQMTRRILKAFESPHVDIFAHPTGRMILEREAYAFDVEKVFTAARDAGVFLEINAHPSRLDLKDTLCRRAKEMGCRMVISTDAHSSAQLNLIPFGVFTARRGWLEKRDVVNTLPLRSFLRALRKR